MSAYKEAFRARPTELQKEKEPSMKKHYTLVTAHTAVAAYKETNRLYDSVQGNPTREQTNAWKADIDQAAATTMEQQLEEIPFRTIKVGSEGAKEIFYAGEAAASVTGRYGKQHYPIVEGVSDVVEGTTPASRREPGASSVIAVVQKPEDASFGIRPTPDNVHYLMKFIGPPQLNGIVDMNRPHEENLRKIIDILGIEPAALTQVTMDPAKPGREVNQPYVDAAQELGVQVKIIGVGDFMAGVRAAMDPKKVGDSPLILVGRGGYEEGIMAGAAARALGGFMQAKEFSPDPQMLAQNPVLNLAEDLVPADPTKTLVSTSFITDDPWFNHPGITEQHGKLVATTMVINHEGIAVKKLVL